MKFKAYLRRAMILFAFSYVTLALAATLAFFVARGRSHHPEVLWGQPLFDHMLHLGEAAVFFFVASLVIARFKTV